MATTKVAVIGGTGDEGSGLAARWAKAGVEVVIGSRDAERAQAAAAKIQKLAGGSVSGLENAAAAASAPIVVVTVPFSGQAAIYRSIADAITPETIVVDCTVPVAAAVGHKATKVLGVWEGSAAQQAQSLLPKGTIMCAGFHSLAAAALNDLDREMEGDVLVCGTKKAARQEVGELVNAIPGLKYVDAGPLDNARIIEPITSLLIGINMRYKTDRSGIRISGLPE
ncbi:MAG: NADPH-dependent F420 reductase [Actinobacteria bacterium]|nr:NADPH-dependent F420 reductase [Actinomycetota bacterium]